MAVKVGGKVFYVMFNNWGKTKTGFEPGCN